MRVLFKSVSRLGSCLLAGLVLLTSGCATHTQNARTSISRLRAGDTAAALTWSEKLKKSSRNQALGCLESGRIKMLSGDFTGSRADFETVINQILDETETGPVIRLGSVGSSLLTATVTDDTVRKYQLPPYEVIQALHYQTLNYLFSGDPQGAEVEMRRTVFAQDALAEACSREIAEAQNKTDANQAGALAAVDGKMTALDPVLERSRSSYENGLVWYFSGLMFEKQGDEADAALCYGKAAELAPANECIRADFLRMLRSQNPQAFAQASVRYPVDPASLTRGSTEIVVLYEEELISQRQAEKIGVWIPDFRGTPTLISIDFPFYFDSACRPEPLGLSAGGTQLGSTEPAVYLQSLAYRDLKEKMPGIVFRNVTRSITKVAAQQVVNRQNNDVARLGMMVLNAAASIASTADTRAWYSIPMVTHLYRGSIPAGEHRLECRASGFFGVTVPVTVAEGETRLVWIANTGGVVATATATLSGKGLPPAFQQFNNSTVAGGVSGK